MGVGTAKVIMMISLRGRGIKVALVASLATATLLWISGPSIPVVIKLLTALSLALSIALVDQKAWETTYYALKIVGTPPSGLSMVALLQGLLGTVILAAPYFIMEGFMIGALAAVTVLATIYGVMKLIERQVDEKLSSPVIPTVSGEVS